jgi:hypothetical protein
MATVPNNSIHPNRFRAAKIGAEWFANFYYAEGDSYYGMAHDNRAMAQRMARSNVDPHVVAYRIRIIKRDPATYLDRLIAAAEWTLRQAYEKWQDGGGARSGTNFEAWSAAHGRLFALQHRRRCKSLPPQTPVLSYDLPADVAEQIKRKRAAKSERDPNWVDRTEGFTETAKPFRLAVPHRGDMSFLIGSAHLEGLRLPHTTGIKDDPDVMRFGSYAEAVRWARGNLDKSALPRLLVVYDNGTYAPVDLNSEDYHVREAMKAQHPATSERDWDNEITPENGWKFSQGSRPRGLNDNDAFEFVRIYKGKWETIGTLTAREFNWELWCHYRPVDKPLLASAADVGTAKPATPADYVGSIADAMLKGVLP